MSSYDLIKDLEKKLGLYSDCHTRPVAAPNRIHEMVANHISESEIYPSLLDKQTVTGLIEDRCSWPVSDGGAYCLAHSVSVEELETAKVISFPNDYLCVQRTLEATPVMPEKLRHQLNAHQFLYDIRYKVSDLVTPHLRIRKDQIKSHELLLIDEHVKPDGEFVQLSIQHDDIVGVGTYLWKRLRVLRLTPDEAFAEYATKMRLASDRSYVFEIDFNYEIDAEEYLQCAYNYLAADKTLREGWGECATEVALSYNGITSITRTQTQYALNHVDSDNESYCEALDISLLGTVTSHITNKSTQTLLEGADWWAVSSRYGYFSRDRLTEHLVWLIIRNERNTYSPADSFPITRKLMDLASSSPKLLGMIFTEVSYPPFLCFLLSNFPTNHIGLIELYKSLQHRHRPISDKVAYEQIWQDLLWTQGLEIYSQSYQKHLEVAELLGALERACEMLAWFSSHELGYNSRGKSISDTRLPSLKISIDSINYITDSGLARSVVDDHSGLICEIVETRLNSLRLPDGIIPLGEWLILFWCIEWSSKSGEHAESQAIKKVCEVLINSYLMVLHERMSSHCNASDDPLAFDELDWSTLYQAASKLQRSRWIYAFEDQKTSVLPKDSSQQRSFIFATRMHLRLLLKLHGSAQDDETAQNELAAEIISLIDLFGFNSGRYSGALDYLSDNSDYSPIRLWPAICNAANTFNAANFECLIEILRIRSAPLSSLFTLLERTAPIQYRSLLLSAIADRDLEEESPNWIPEVFDVVLKAANTGQTRIAEYFLNFAKKHSHKTYKNKIDELVAKLDIKRIFEDPSLSEELKIEALRQYKVESEDRQVRKEVQSFRAYLIATLNISIDTEKAIRMFSESLNTEPTIQNATGLIKSALLYPGTSKSPTPLEDYFQIWMDVFKKSQFPQKKVEISDSDLNSILQLCLELSRLDDFSDLWGIATTQQRAAYELAPLRAEYLKRTGRTLDAVTYIQKLREIHQGLPQPALEELFNIEANLQNQQTSLHAQIAPPQTVEISSSQENLRNVWLSIRDLGAFDQSQIFMQPTNSIDDYLLQIVEQVGNELLLRCGNLQRKKPTAPSSFTSVLDDEDMINDWFVSLVKQRMNFAGWKIYDQSRRGRSASGKGVGETDGWIEDGQGNSISMIEAFRLGQNIDRSTIRQHLDKISKYNSTGTSPLFIVVYTATNNFPKLCSQYAEYVQGLEYQGFDSGKFICLQKRKMKIPKASSVYYEETRFINEAPIKIYHQLLDLKPPLEPS